jgi:starch phosphorylase
LIAPEFYQRDESGIPRAWVARMRGSMGRLTPAYGSNRMMRDYVQQAYLPAMAQQRHRIANGNQAAREMRLWAERLRECWPRLSIGQVEVSATGRGWSFSALVRLDQLGADDVRVELFANPIGNGAPEIRAMSRGEPSAGPGNGWVYSGRVDSTRPAHDYTVRIVPHHPNARIPTEAALILWQK